MSTYAAFLAGLAIGWCIRVLMERTNQPQPEPSSLTVRRVIRLDDYRESPKVWEVN